MEKEGNLTLTSSTFTSNAAKYGGALAGGQYLTLQVGPSFTLYEQEVTPFNKLLRAVPTLQL